MESVKGMAKPIWRKVPTFGRAVAYMLSKGESERSSNEVFAQMLAELEGESPIYYPVIVLHARE